MTHVKTLCEMLELLIAVITRCICRNNIDKANLSHTWKFKHNGRENTIADILAHAHVFLMNLKDERASGGSIKVSSKYFSELCSKNQKLEDQITELKRELAELKTVRI